MKKLLRIESFIQPTNYIFTGNGKYYTRAKDRKRQCSYCSNEATKKAIFDMDGAQLIEKYCDDCVMRIQSS